jgi:hypothetical protein
MGGDEPVADPAVIGFKITSQALGKKMIRPASRKPMPNESVR